MRAARSAARNSSRRNVTWAHDPFRNDRAIFLGEGRSIVLLKSVRRYKYLFFCFLRLLWRQLPQATGVDDSQFAAETA